MHHRWPTISLQRLNQPYVLELPDMGTGHLSCQTPPARLAITQYINAGLAEVCSIRAFTLCNTPSREPISLHALFPRTRRNYSSLFFCSVLKTVGRWRTSVRGQEQKVGSSPDDRGRLTGSCPRGVLARRVTGRKGAATTCFQRRGRAGARRRDRFLQT